MFLSMSTSKLLYHQIHKRSKLNFPLNVIIFDLINRYKFTMKVPNFIDKLILRIPLQHGLLKYYNETNKISVLLLFQ